MQPLKIYIVNLARSPIRRETITARLSALKCNFEIFEAIDGTAELHPLFQRYDDSLRLKSRRRPLSVGELGCWASHYLLWQRCVESNTPMIIMEDDVEVEDCFVDALALITPRLEQLRYIRLAGTSLDRRPYKVVGKVANFDLVDHIRGPAGTLCYAINPDAASALMRNAESWYQAVDDYIDRYWVHGVDCYSLMPFPVKVGNMQSDIQRHEKQKLVLTQKMRQEYFRRLDQWKRIFYRLFVRKNTDLLASAKKTN